MYDLWLLGLDLVLAGLVIVIWQLGNRLCSILDRRQANLPLSASKPILPSTTNSVPALVVDPIAPELLAAKLQQPPRPAGGFGVKQ